jgi:hypothetical protein
MLPSEELLERQASELTPLQQLLATAHYPPNSMATHSEPDGRCARIGSSQDKVSVFRPGLRARGFQIKVSLVDGAI